METVFVESSENINSNSLKYPNPQLILGMELFYHMGDAYSKVVVVIKLVVVKRIKLN